jgi:hypothetical protein
MPQRNVRDYFSRQRTSGPILPRLGVPQNAIAVVSSLLRSAITRWTPLAPSTARPHSRTELLYEPGSACALEW